MKLIEILKQDTLSLSFEVFPPKIDTAWDSVHTAVREAGSAYATDRIIDPYANNVTNVHVCSMNKPQVARKIQGNLSDMLGK